MINEKKEPLAPGLYIVATPIGNLGDMTRRAISILENADIVLCEDTRVSGKLLHAYGLKKPLLPYHDYNADKVRPEILQRIAGGESFALISDAGTPLVSDPGYKLVRDCAALGLFVTALPGASSVMAALVLSGLPTDRFMFAGFLPEKSKARRDLAQSLAQIPATLIFFESTRRLPESLADLAQVMGGARLVAVARELTKMFEEVRRGTLDDLAAHYAKEGEPKGEAVLVIGPSLTKEVSGEDADKLLSSALDEGLSVRDASDNVAEMTGLSRKSLYARALDLKKGRE